MGSFVFLCSGQTDASSENGGTETEREVVQVHEHLEGADRREREETLLLEDAGTEIEIHKDSYDLP